MKPRNEFQRRVVKLAKKLKPITEEDGRFFGEHATENLLFDNGKKTTCNRCGNQFVSVPWKGKKTMECPRCKRKCTLKKSKRTAFKDNSYMAVLTTIEDVQVVRMYMLKYTWRLDWQKEGFSDMEEAFRIFVNEDGQYAIMARLTRQPSYYIDEWNFNSTIELRPDHDRYYVSPWHTRTHRIAPWLRKRGFKGDFHYCAPASILTELLKNSHIETLWKAGYYDFGLNRNQHYANEYWNELKICIRNHYKIKDVTLWCDTISNLRELELDTHNAHYVCPKNLNKAHDEYRLRLERMRAKKEKECERKKIRMNEKGYRERMRCYIGIMFGSNDINLHVLKDVEEFFDEGSAMHHCVYTNGYYKRKDTLILSAQSKGTRLATIELNLNDMSIVQCRGVCNKKPDRDEEIRSILKHNLGIIRKARKLQLEEKDKNLSLMVS